MVTYLQEAFEKPPGNLELEKKKRDKDFVLLTATKLRFEE